MPETATKSKPFVSRYEETPAYKAKGEANGHARMILAIDGKAGRIEFWHRIDEDRAYRVATMVRHILKGKTPAEAFSLAFPETEGA